MEPEVVRVSGGRVGGEQSAAELIGGERDGRGAGSEEKKPVRVRPGTMNIPEGEDSAEGEPGVDQPKQQEPISDMQVTPAAVQKLLNTFPDISHPTTQGRARCGAYGSANLRTSPSAGRDTAIRRPRP